MKLRIALVCILFAATAYASGSISVTGYPAVPRVLKGGTGINIGTDGTFTATGVAVPVGTVTTETFAAYTSAHKNIAGTAGNLDGGTATSTFLTQIDGGGAY